MNTTNETEVFSRWLAGLSDPMARLRIVKRVKQAAAGHFGDCGPVGEGVSEIRIDYGPGYRLYYAREGDTIYLLLAGGIKDSQPRDIRRAKAIWKDVKGK